MKLWSRFIAYSTCELLFFSVYTCISLPSFLKYLVPRVSSNANIELESFASTSELLLVLIELMICFISAVILFRILIVIPVINVISVTQRIGEGDFCENNTNRRCENVITGFMFSEIFTTVQNLRIRLDIAIRDRTIAENAKRFWIKGISRDLKTLLSYIICYLNLNINQKYTSRRC